jgi:heme-degrading monooxygenase HmoA
VTNDPQSTGLVVAWLYRARPERREDFERVYGPEGVWARLFARSDGFLGTELRRDGDRYLVLDQWRSAEAYERFGRVFESEYAALSAETRPLYLEETRLGAFGRLSVPGTVTTA